MRRRSQACCSRQPAPSHRRSCCVSILQLLELGAFYTIQPTVALDIAERIVKEELTLQAVVLVSTFPPEPGFEAIREGINNVLGLIQSQTNSV